MAEVKWIKISTGMFETNRKIKQIENMPDGDTILVIWLKLLILAGNVNDGGAVYLTPEIPYTDEMLADEFRRPLNTVRLALSVFQRFGMIEIIDDILYLPSWEKYQSTDKLAEIREYNREAQRRSRERRKLITVNDMSMTSQPCHDTDIDIDKELDIDNKGITAQQVVDLYHSICKSYPKLQSLSAARKKAINARLKTYSLIEFEQVFKKAEASNFMKGENSRNWSANFDWMLQDSKFPKILKGYYDNKEAEQPKANTTLNFTNMMARSDINYDDIEARARAQLMGGANA